jgi:GPI ethanolamine phosphate transferase 1
MSDTSIFQDATSLDIWSYDKLEELLANATANATGPLFKSLHEPRVIFFLHLLGLDTTGHSFRPHSKEYMRNIQVVDSIVKKTETLLEHFYGSDGKTAFIFTADHGMSNIGNHGDGGKHLSITVYDVNC